jgi:hypothetical protein
MAARGHVERWRNVRGGKEEVRVRGELTEWFAMGGAGRRGAGGVEVALGNEPSGGPSCAGKDGAEARREVAEEVEGGEAKLMVAWNGEGTAR